MIAVPEEGHMTAQQEFDVGDAHSSDDAPMPLEVRPAGAATGDDAGTRDDAGGGERDTVAASETDCPQLPFAVNDSEIREAAYLRAMQRGFVSGSEIDDWLWAESQLQYDAWHKAARK
jgi:Protein of unknown function (DUF2934)